MRRSSGGIRYCDGKSELAFPVVAVHGENQFAGRADRASGVPDGGAAKGSYLPEAPRRGAPCGRAAGAEVGSDPQLAGGVGRPMAALVPGEAERSFPERRALRRRVVRSLSDRCRMILRRAGDPPNKAVAELGVRAYTVGKWRRRFPEDRSDGLSDGPRSGRPRTIGWTPDGTRNPSGGRNPPTTSPTPSNASVTGSAIITLRTSVPGGRPSVRLQYRRQANCGCSSTLIWSDGFRRASKASGNPSRSTRSVTSRAASTRSRASASGTSPQCRLR